VTEPAWPARSVSAVIPHYGDPAHAQQAVSDLLEQAGDHLLEVIVVDDCSPAPFPDGSDVQVVRREKNGGFGAAVNSGAAVCQGELLLIVNSDVRLPRLLLSDLLDRARPLMPAVVGPLTVSASGEDEPTGRRFPTARHWAIERLVVLQRFSGRRWYQRATGRVSPDGTRPRRVDWLQGSLLLMPIADFRSVGGFDERFYLYSEEVDLQRRLGAAGVHAWLLPSVTIQHEGGASTDFSRSHEWLVRSRITYADKWGELATLRWTMRVVAVVNLATRTLLRLTGRPTAPRVAWRREMESARTEPWPIPADDRPA
jgi:N-acetylglucosaminyl-diphospho-decaprenol L-rhamnosyltransferase